jgi:hypothetical protein
MKFTLNRNHVLQSVLGHSIAFKKGEPTHVPSDLWDAALGIGAQPEDEMPEAMAEDTKEPLDLKQRKAAIFAGFDAMVAANKRESFMGTGAPHIKAIAAQIGFVVDANERDTLWQEYKTMEKAE